MMVSRLLCALISTSVLSLRIAANATSALKLADWFLLFLFMYLLLSLTQFHQHLLSKIHLSPCPKNRYNF